MATDDDGYTVYGWVCGSLGSLVHVYVVPELRNKSVATSLIKHACGELEELARPWPLRGSVNQNPVNPYLLCVKEAEHG